MISKIVPACVAAIIILLKFFFKLRNVIFWRFLSCWVC